MKESFIKFIIIALIAFFSASMVYAETDYSKPIWTDVNIGYKLDHFSPTKKDTTQSNKGFFAQCVSKQSEELNRLNKEAEKYKINIPKVMILSLLCSILIFFGDIVITIILLALIGILILITVKLIKDITNKP